ncbi:MAG: hypothetical protein Q7J84_14970, partial [Sulfuricaulis sp.]|nr:hypothetical protein [Sulfuricaulis sp.]
VRYRLRRRPLSDPLDTVGVNIHQLVSLEQRLHLRPDTSQERVKISAPQITKALGRVFSFS